MIELASSGHSSCRACGQPIATRAPRWIVSVSNPLDPDETDDHYYDLACAAQLYPHLLGDALVRFSEPFPQRAELERRATLWTAALADVTDLEARTPLADVLQLAGDPRGVLMSGQLLGEDMSALLATHGAHWLDGGAPYVKAARFDAGLVAAVELGTKRIDGTAIAAFRFITEAQVGDASSASYAQLVSGLRHLRRVEVWDIASLEAFEATPSPVTHVACGLWKRESSRGARFLRACAAKPSLTSLAIGIAAFDALLASPVFARLASLTLVVDRLRDVIPLAAELPDEIELRVSRSARLPSLATEPAGELVLGATTVRATGEWVRAGLVAHLPSTTQALVVDREVRALRSECRERAIELTVEPSITRAGIWKP